VSDSSTAFAEVDLQDLINKLIEDKIEVAEMDGKKVLAV
jgi:hypothetical protein